MKAITLWQPWASLLACGAKQFETRSWATSYRGPIAIHAAAKKPSTIWEAIASIIDAARAALGIIDPDDLPRGCIIATAELVECWKMDRAGHTVGRARAVRIANDQESKFNIVQGIELLFGDWTPGRYAWEFANMQLLPEPIPAKGGQRLWNWAAGKGVATAAA